MELTDQTQYVLDFIQDLGITHTKILEVYSGIGYQGLKKHIDKLLYAGEIISPSAGILIAVESLRSDETLLKNSRRVFQKELIKDYA